MSEAAAPSGFGSHLGAGRLLSDERLVRRATEGDDAAFAAIFRRYHQDLYRFCLAILGDSQDAQDALQNTMLKVMRALPGERREIQLKPWLYRIAHNESIEAMRRRAPIEELDPELATPAASPPEEAEQRARLRRLVADMEELPERQRAVLVMREMAGLGFEEIGAAFGTSPAVARQTLYEARLSLRQMEEGRELSCDSVTRALSDADGRVTRRRDIRAHLRGCPACREFRDEIKRRRGDFAALTPLPAAAAAGVLQALLGGGGPGGVAGAGMAGGAAVAAGKAAGVSALGTSALVKGTATVAVVAAIGVGAADRGGLVDVGLPGGGSSKDAPARSEPAGTAPGASVGVGGARVTGASSGGVGESRRSTREGGRQAESTATAPRAAGTGAGATGTGSPSPAPGAYAAQGNAGGHGASHGNSQGASQHGQETAASHKGTNGSAASGDKGNGGAAQGTPKPTHAAKPEHAVEPEPPPRPEPPEPAPPAGPESAGGGNPASPPETPAGELHGPPSKGSPALSEP